MTRQAMRRRSRKKFLVGTRRFRNSIGFRLGGALISMWDFFGLGYETFVERRGSKGSAVSFRELVRRRAWYRKRDLRIARARGNK
jgi:hypothetical protein